MGLIENISPLGRQVRDLALSLFAPRWSRLRIARFRTNKGY
jgi:hypothetical protein